jgi:hypothetical protein
MLAPRVPTTPHRPARPSWDCQYCWQPWPCPPVGRDLGVEFEGKPTFLFFYMAAQVEDFTSDRTAQGQLPTADVYPRFVHWIRSATTRAA